MAILLELQFVGRASSRQVGLNSDLQKLHLQVLQVFTI